MWLTCWQTIHCWHGWMILLSSWTQRLRLCRPSCEVRLGCWSWQQRRMCATICRAQLYGCTMQGLRLQDTVHTVNELKPAKLCCRCAILQAPVP